MNIVFFVIGGALALFCLTSKGGRVINLQSEDRLGDYWPEIEGSAKSRLTETPKPPLK